MRLVVTDSSSKIPNLRTAFPSDQIVAVDFPLFSRYTKTAKLKSDSWPKLKPIAKAKIEKLVSAASKCGTVVGVFDASDYGRVLARDVQEALCGVNAQVSFLFPDDFRPATIISAQSTELYESPDNKFVLDRMVSNRIKVLMESMFNDAAEMAVTRQQALILGLLKTAADKYKSYAFVDRLGRIFTASRNEPAPVAMKQAEATIDVAPNALICAPVSWERLWPAIEKLQAQGLITMREQELSEESFDVFATLITSYGLEPRSNPPPYKWLWPTDPTFNSRLIVDELAARPLYEWMVAQAVASCCEPQKAVKLLGKAGDFQFSGVLASTSSLAPLAGLQVTPPVELEQPVKDKVLLNDMLITIASVADQARAFISEREIWSSVNWLLRKNLIVRRGQGIYLSSRGCAAAMALDACFPAALTCNLTELVEDLALEENTDEILNNLNAYFSEVSEQLDTSFWSDFTKGKASASTSLAATFFILDFDKEDPSKFMGLAHADGAFRAVRQGLKLEVACSCGNRGLSTRFNSFYEMEWHCIGCDKTYPITTLPR